VESTRFLSPPGLAGLGIRVAEVEPQSPRRSGHVTSFGTVQAGRARSTRGIKTL
jgi:hypothetical protein